MFKKFGILFAVLMVMVLIGAGYAFAAANTVEKSDAGYVASTISGYDITKVAYNYASGDPTTLNTITFEIAPRTEGDLPAKTVKINTTKTTADWSSWACVPVTTTKTVVTCTFTDGTPVASVEKLDIYASSN